MNINETEKILMEQCIFNVANEDLTGEDYLIEAINHYIDSDDPGYNICEVLQESIEYSEYNKYVPLLEAIDILNEATKEAVAADNAEAAKKASHKFGDAIKRAATWYYKIDPETKARNVRTISSIVITLLQKAIRIYAQWKMTGRFPMAIEIGRNIVGGIASIAKAKSDAKEQGISYKEYKELHKPKEEPKPKEHKNLDQRLEDVRNKAKNAAAEGIEMALSKKFIISTLINKGITLIFGLIAKLDHALYYKINVKDLDENIRKYDKLIDEFNDKISEEDDIEIRKALIKGRDNCVRALRDLYAIKEEKKKRDEKSKKTIGDVISDKATKVGNVISAAKALKE